MTVSMETQLKLMLGLYVIGVFTLVLWIPAGLWAGVLYWQTRHPVARGGWHLFLQSWVFWITAFVILPFSLSQLAILVPAFIITAWAGFLLYRSVMLWSAIDVTPID